MAPRVAATAAQKEPPNLPRPSKARIGAAILLMGAAMALTGCLTPKAKAPPSAAILEARKGAGQKAAPCQSARLEDVSPTSATFPFDDSLLDEMGQQRLRKVAAYLACHPQTPVVVLPSADHHLDEAHQKDLAGRRAQAVTQALRAEGGDKAVVRMLAMGAADPLTEPHILIRAEGRGW
jgi:outer membrane protein OmpA-like peptidoglycan-associated protein